MKLLIYCHNRSNNRLIPVTNFVLFTTMTPHSDFNYEFNDCRAVK